MSTHFKRLSQRGAASLIVVMVLFFVLSLVAAYTGRNLVFEQRTSVNQFRATQALEAAEAGVEWALAMLNSGRINSTCLQAGATSTNTSFRQRYLNIDQTSGAITARLTSPGNDLLMPSCVFNGTDWVCSCPENSAPSLSPPTGTGVFPAFRIRFRSDTVNATSPGVIQIESQGCTRLDVRCLNFPATAIESEGRALVTVYLALKPAIATRPAAAVTVVGNLDPLTRVTATNTEADRGGLALHVGNPSAAIIDVADTRFVLRGPPGTPASALTVIGDSALTGLQDVSNRVFPVMLGTRPLIYRDQPAAIRFNCPVAGCRDALAIAVSLNPGRIFWIAGDLTLESAGNIGSLPDPGNPSVAGPVMLVVEGRFRNTGNARVFGYVYTRPAAVWSGGGDIQGATFVEGNLGETANLNVTVVGSVLDAMRNTHGSFIRIPGSWKDFQ